MTLIGKKAPSFRAAAVINGNKIVQDFSLDTYQGKQAVVLFFYPKDFTFVCPTELYALQKRIDEFTQRNVAIVACSTDTEETHWAWLHVERSQGGIQGVQYPLVADTTKTIAANFGVLAGSWYLGDQGEVLFQGTPVAHRGTFLIDKEGIIRHMLINDLSLGRNIDEILRTIDMMNHVDKHGEVCPADWQAGERALDATTEGLLDYLADEIASSYDPARCACNPGSSCGNMNCQCQPSTLSD